VQLHPVLLGEGHVGEHVMLGVVHAGAELRPAGAQLVGDLAPDLCRGSVVGLEEDLADSGGNNSVLALGHVGQGIAHEVDAATLPGGAEHSGDRCLEALVGGLSGFPCVAGHNGQQGPTMSRRKEPAIPNELLDQLLAGGAASAAFEQGGLLDSLKKALTERALNAEMDHHLAGEDGAGNMRNGYGRKTVMTDTGKLAIDVPRDRQSSFDPQLIAKYQRRFPGFDDKIVSMYARGMSTREITRHLHDLYGIDVSPDLISTVTDAVLDEVATWQQRPLDPVYPLVFFDAIRVKIRDEGMVRNKAIHIALGVRADGAKEVLGLWLEQNEGAKFWLRVMNELRNRGVEDILLAVVDGLKGFPDAITAVFPDAIVQTCIVHLLRNSMDFVSWKDRKNLASALKEIYRATDADAAEKALTAFEAGPWGQRYPAIGQSWRRAGAR
jgi:putative transposase